MTTPDCRNPWIDKAKATADFGDDEYMVRRVLHTWPLPCSEHKAMLAESRAFSDALPYPFGVTISR